MSIHKALLEEIERRRGGPCAYDEEGTQFLFQLNDRLAEFDAGLARGGDGDWPVIWVLGCPRTGTTLATQVLCRCLDAGYVDGVAARFWRAPLTGLALSRQLLGPEPGRRIDFFSRYAKTDNLASPHEFSYFWHKWLKLEDAPPYDPREADGRIDWAGFRRLVMDMAGLCGRGLVFKAFDAGFHLERFARVFPRSLFVYTLRTSLDVAVSLARGRLHHFGSLDAWWSNCPVEYPELLKLPWPDQIAGQILHFTRMYEEGLARLEPEQVLVLPYARLCAEPDAVVAECARRLEAWKGGCGRVAERLEQPFRLERPEAGPEIVAPLRRALEQWGLDPDREPGLGLLQRGAQ